VRHLRQQIWDVVPAKLKVTEHRLAVVSCQACGCTTQGEFAGYLRAGGVVRVNPASTKLVTTSELPTNAQGRALTAKEVRYLISGPAIGLE
jgi:hypothetical protein